MVDGRTGAGVYLDYLVQFVDNIRHIRNCITDVFASVPSELCKMIKNNVSEQSKKDAQT